jgi:hypothetical protein
MALFAELGQGVRAVAQQSSTIGDAANAYGGLAPMGFRTRTCASARSWE